MSSAAAGDALARAGEWVDHLRRGGTTPWLEWHPAAASRSTRAPEAPRPGGRTSGELTSAAPLPGAQQLELLRRINLAARAGSGSDPVLVDPVLVDRVLAASAPGRGALDLPLLGTVDGEPFGAPAVDPAALAARELLRPAVGLLADAAAAAPDQPGPARWRPRASASPRPLPWRRYPRLVGDPVLARALRAGFAAERCAPGRGDVLVLGGDLEQLMAAVWTVRILDGGTASWRDFCASWSARDQLPPRADLAVQAAAWAGRGRVVQVVMDPGAIAGLVRTRRPLAAPAPTPAAALEVTRRVSRVLGLMVPAPRRTTLIRAVLDDAIAAVARSAAEPDRLGEDGSVRAWWLPPAVPGEQRAWLLRQATDQRRALAAAEYPVHGRLEALLPAESPADPPVTPASLDAAALTLAVRMLLDGGRGPIQQRGRRETRNKA